MIELEITEADVTTALRKCFPNENVKLVKWKIISFNEEGKLGYLGDHFRVDTIVHRFGKDEDVSFFVKTIPMNKVQQDLVKAGSMYRKEALFYNQVANEIISVLSKVRPMVPDSKVFVIPRCYLATDTMLIMEDLHKCDFKGKSADVPLSVDFFLKSMRALARFHASSIVLEECLGKPLITEYPDLDFETFLDGSPDHCLVTWHAASLHAANALMPLLEKYKEKPEVIKKTQAALPGLVKELMASAKAWTGTKNAFCHGDLWTNNILFRMDQAGNPIEAVLVDYQLLRYAPPATDIITFLMFSADKAFRDKHFEQVVREYHDELKLTLQDLGYDVDKLLPWDELRRTLKDWWKCGLTLMLLEYPLALAPSELMDPILNDNEKYRQHFLVNRTPFAVNLFTEYEMFRSRYSEVCEELIDNYIIKT